MENASFKTHTSSESCCREPTPLLFPKEGVSPKGGLIGGGSGGSPKGKGRGTPPENEHILRPLLLLRGWQKFKGIWPPLKRSSLENCTGGLAPSFFPSSSNKPNLSSSLRSFSRSSSGCVCMASFEVVKFNGVKTAQAEREARKLKGEGGGGRAFNAPRARHHHHQSSEMA